MKLIRAGSAVMLGALLASCLAGPASGAAGLAGGAAPATAVPAAACRSSSHQALAARLAAGIDAALTRAQEALATAMITRSDNDAASALWDDVGRRHLQRFLNLAAMTRTYLGPGPYWGLTQITRTTRRSCCACCLAKNTVLDTASRDYETGSPPSRQSPGSSTAS